VVSIDAARVAWYVGDLAVGRRSTGDEFRRRLLPLSASVRLSSGARCQQAGGRRPWAARGLGGPSHIVGPRWRGAGARVTGRSGGLGQPEVE
jgi:hypothetical protein